MTLSDLQNAFSADSKAAHNSITEYQKAFKYYNGHQLREVDLAELKRRNQRPIVENIYKMIINKILGYKTQSIQEVRLSPRQQEDKPLCAILNDLVRVFSQSEHYDREIMRRDRDLIAGLSVVELWVEQDSDKDYNIQIKTLSPLSFLIDKYSIEQNASDARRFHKVVQLDKASAESLVTNPYLETNADQEQRATIIETWVREFDKVDNILRWNRYLWNPQGGIYELQVSPFKTNDHPFVIQKFYIDEKNNWYGLFRDIKPLQDYINIAENRMANMMGSFKALFEEDAALDIQDFVDDLSLDNAIVKVRSGALKEGKIQFLNNHADIAALSQKANEKRNLTKIIAGLNDESLGVAVNRQSGVAIAQRRESGLMGLQDFIKIGDDMDKAIFKKAIDFICKYFEKKQIFKIVEKDVGERYFEINSNAENKIRAGKFDLIYKTQLKTDSRDEKFAHWSEMFKTIAPVRPEIAGNLLVAMMRDCDSPVANEIEEMIAKADEANAKNAEQVAPMQQQRAELELRALAAEVAEKEAKAHKYSAQGDLVEVTKEQTEAFPPALQDKDNKGANPQNWQKYQSALGTMK